MSFIFGLRTIGGLAALGWRHQGFIPQLLRFDVAFRGVAIA